LLDSRSEHANHSSRSVPIEATPRRPRELAAAHNLLQPVLDVFPAPASACRSVSRNSRMLQQRRVIRGSRMSGASSGQGRRCCPRPASRRRCQRASHVQSIHGANAGQLDVIDERSGSRSVSGSRRAAVAENRTGILRRAKRTRNRWRVPIRSGAVAPIFQALFPGRDPWHQFCAPWDDSVPRARRRIRPSSAIDRPQHVGRQEAPCGFQIASADGREVT